MRLTQARSLLFLPATSTRLLAKAAERGADALIVDLEDSVPLDRKTLARSLARRAVDGLADRSPTLVRVNAEPEQLQADLASLPLDRLAGILLPKVESAEQVRSLAAQLGKIRGERVAPLPIVALIESPLGVLRAEAIATADPDVCALGFGAEDYAAALSVEPLPQAVSWAAQSVVNCARAFGLPCWGLPGSVAEIADMRAFGELVIRAREIGFSGSVCIHPRQVPVVNAGFAPSEQQLAWARRVVAAAEAARAAGVDVVVVDGRMVDRPIVDRASRWIDSSPGRRAAD